MSVPKYNDRLILSNPLHPRTFDQFLEDGWRFLGQVAIKHSVAYYRQQFVWTVPLRIKLEGFEFSKSQRKLLRRNKEHFQIVNQKILEPFRPDFLNIFNKHTARFIESKPEGLGSFLHPFANLIPCDGHQFMVYDGAKLIAVSFYHVGIQGISGTYGFFDPEYYAHGLSNFTMLLELEKCMELGKKFYYHGYDNNIGPYFTYKRNFNNLQRFNWESDVWEDAPREVPTAWRKELEIRD